MFQIKQSYKFIFDFNARIKDATADAVKDAIEDAIRDAIQDAVKKTSLPSRYIEIVTTLNYNIFCEIHEHVLYHDMSNLSDCC